MAAKTNADGTEAWDNGNDSESNDCVMWTCERQATTEIYLTRPDYIVDQCDWIDEKVAVVPVCEGCLKSELSDPDSRYHGERAD